MERMFERSEQTMDVPMELIGILEGALDAVEQFGFNGGAGSVRERVALEACQELKRLPRRIPVDGGSRSVQERKQRLAKKEAVWYLGAVLQTKRRCCCLGEDGWPTGGQRKVARLSAVESEFVLGRAIAE
jgi:hypothetical protein